MANVTTLKQSIIATTTNFQATLSTLLSLARTMSDDPTLATALAALDPQGPTVNQYQDFMSAVNELNTLLSATNGQQITVTTTTGGPVMLAFDRMH